MRESLGGAAIVALGHGETRTFHSRTLLVATAGCIVTSPRVICTGNAQRNIADLALDLQ